MYQAEQAHTKARERRVSWHRLETKSGEVIQIIQHYLSLTWFPEQLSNPVLQGMISFKTIYRWI